MTKIGMVSLGCPKNQVDAEIMLSLLSEGGYEITPDENEADIIIINTCGFIADAKKEAIENILECAELKKTAKLQALIVTGCLAERYRDEILTELPEVDAVVGIGSNADICDIVKRVSANRPCSVYGDKSELLMDSGRILASPPYTAYLRIADGCDNRCSYCAIPLIRGAFRSRRMENIISEANELAQKGVRELVLIAQDTTRYGEDIYGKYALADLLDELCKIDGIKWIRILYAYPDKITDELIDTIARQEKICKYIDIPMQHASPDILKRMNRSGDCKALKALLDKLRRRIPNITVRTTLMTGFPGETERDFEILAQFVKTAEFDRMGCFAYSPEEGTSAAEFDGQVDEDLKQRRREILMDEQLPVNEKKTAERLNCAVTVLVEGYDTANKYWYGRSEADAPDIDQKVFFKSDIKLAAGDFVTVQTEDSIDFDLIGHILRKDEAHESSE